MESGDQPQGGGQMTPEQLMELQRALIQLVAALGPSPDNSEASHEAAAKALQRAHEQENSQEFAQLWDALFNPAKVEAKPRWGVRLHHRSLGDQPHLFHCPKRLKGEGGSNADLASWALAFGLLTSPQSRAVLMLHGYHIEFVEIAQRSPILQ